MRFASRPEHLAEGSDFGRHSLSDGSFLTAWSSVDGMFVQRERGGTVAAELHFPYPRLGLGGGRLVVSPGGRHAILSYFSGQSEEAFELIGLDGGLQALAHKAYTFGEDAEFGFSPEEDLLVMFIPQRADTWWPDDDEELERDDDGRRRFYLGRLIVHTIASGQATPHELYGLTERAESPEDTDWQPSPIPDVAHDRLRLALPWGPVDLRLPLPSAVVVHVP